MQDKLGLVIFTEKTIISYKVIQRKSVHPLLNGKGNFLKACNDGGLRGDPITEQKTRWLEIGCGGTFDDNITYVDLFPETVVSQKGKFSGWTWFTPPIRHWNGLVYLT